MTDIQNHRLSEEVMDKLKSLVEGNGYQVPTYGIAGKWYLNDALLDADFWQALSKALGWEPATGSFGSVSRPGWMHHAFEYFDIKLTGGNEEKFWEEVGK